MKKIFFVAVISTLFALPIFQAVATPGGWGGWGKVCETSSGIGNSYKSCQWKKYYYNSRGQITSSQTAYTNGRFWCPRP